MDQEDGSCTRTHSSQNHPAQAILQNGISLRAPQQSASTPLQHKFLIYHPTTTTMPRVKARAAKDEERETKIRQAFEERAQFNTSFEDLHHNMVFRRAPCATGPEARKAAKKRTKITRPSPLRRKMRWRSGHCKWILRGFLQDSICLRPPPRNSFNSNCAMNQIRK